MAPLRFVLICALGVMVLSASAFTQTKKPARPGATAQATRTASPGDATKANAQQEQELKVIEIKAVVEKPGVAILPKRAEPEFGEIEFVDRSFDHELKQGPARPMFIDSELESAQKLEKLKKLLAKEKK